MCTLRYPVILALVAGAILLVPLAPTPALGWQFVVPNGENVIDSANAVAFDGNHPVAAGQINFVLSVVKLNRKDGHEIWRFQDPSSTLARAVAVDAKGHVIVAGDRFTVIKLDRHTGIPHWLTTVAGGDTPLGVGVDAAGDVIAAGVLDNEFGIVKLRGTDGTELWRAQPRTGGSGQVRALAIDRRGNAVAAGWTVQESGGIAFAVVKVAALDGSEQWRRLISDDAGFGFPEAVAVSVDAAGDVVAGGVVQIFLGTQLTQEFTVVKLAAADGTLRWRRDVRTGGPPHSGGVRAVAVDAHRNVIAAGIVDGQPLVVKLAGADGTELWRNAETGGSTLDVDAEGDVAVGATVLNGPQRFDAVVSKLAGGTGAQVWRHVFNGSGNGDDAARAVAFDRHGNVVMVGELTADGPGTDFAVEKLRGFDGSDFCVHERRSSPCGHTSRDRHVPGARPSQKADDQEELR